MVHVYGSPAYARTLSHYGTAVELHNAGGCVFHRPILGSDRHDLVGPYPWAEFDDWSAVRADLDRSLGRDVLPVSAVLVVSPTSGVDRETLRRNFPDHLAEFKQHYLVDLSIDLQSRFRSSHRRKMRRAATGVTVEPIVVMSSFAPSWVELYSHLMDRHQIEGVARFPPESLRQQLELPGSMAFAAVDGDLVLGAITFMVSGTTAAYHLGSYSPAGYEREVAFALFPAAFEYLRDIGVRLVNLGGGAGLASARDDGLTQFKRGWSTRSEASLLCGRIIDREAYSSLSADAGDSTYFPRYRTPVRQ